MYYKIKRYSTCYSWWYSKLCIPLLDISLYTSGCLWHYLHLIVIINTDSSIILVIIINGTKTCHGILLLLWKDSCALFSVVSSDHEIRLLSLTVVDSTTLTALSTTCSFISTPRRLAATNIRHYGMREPPRQTPRHKTERITQTLLCSHPEEDDTIPESLQRYQGASKQSESVVWVSTSGCPKVLKCKIWGPSQVEGYKVPKRLPEYDRSHRLSQSITIHWLQTWTTFSKI